MKKTFLLFAVLFVVAGLRAQTMDLSGLWRFQFDPMGCRRCQGLHIVHEPVVRHMPFPHLVIDHVFRFRDRWIIGNTRGQIVAKFLRYSD